MIQVLGDGIKMIAAYDMSDYVKLGMSNRKVHNTILFNAIIARICDRCVHFYGESDRIATPTKDAFQFCQTI